MVDIRIAVCLTVDNLGRLVQSLQGQLSDGMIQ